MSHTPGASSVEPSGKAAGGEKQELLRDIERLVGREPMDRVKCVNVFGDFYRCNWWAPSPVRPGGVGPCDWGIRATHYVRASRFLQVTVSNGRLTILELGDAEHRGAAGPVLRLSVAVPLARVAELAPSAPLIDVPPAPEGE
jgi:hypothetical protein